MNPSTERIMDLQTRLIDPPAIAFCFSTCALIAGAAQVAAWLGVEL